jgi:hypothetical protein
VEKGLAIQVDCQAIAQADKPFSQIVTELEAAYLASDPKISEFLGGEYDIDYDWDGDGMSDVYELDYGFNPDDDDEMGDDGASGPDGTLDGQNDWDGDGCSNQGEEQGATDPTDAESFPVPVAGVFALLVLAVALAVLGMVFRRRKVA